jgi:hypothetical protein
MGIASAFDTHSIVWFSYSVKSVHPLGKFIKYSTKVAFKLPPIASLSGREFFAIVSALAFPLRQSRDVGVGYISALTASIRLPPFLALRGVTRPP